MRDFKSLMCKMQGQNKTNLRWLYVDSFSTDPDCIEDEKVFTYNDFSFWFQGTGRRSAERILMMIALPMEANREEEIPVSTFLLKRIGPLVQAWSEENQNDNKVREKAQFFVQAPGNRMLRRNGLTYDEKRNANS